MPPPAVVRKELRPKPPRASDIGTNTLVFPLPGIRRLDIVLCASIDTRRDTSEIWWALSAWATILDPADNLPGFTSPPYVNIAPSLVWVPPLGAGVMHVVTIFWPALPPASELSVKFSTAADQPEGNAIAFGYANTTPHNENGIFVSPYGHPKTPARLVSLPDDPEMLRRLALEDRIPPPRAPRPPIR
jgi:hypothetical protein